MEKPRHEPSFAPPERRAEDRVYLSARREALVVLVVFVIAMVWSVGYSYAFGYDGDIRKLTFVFGFPSWVFWGVVVPWAVCIGRSVFFGAYFVRDEDLGEEPPADEIAAQPADHIAPNTPEREPGNA